jgi:MFS family permease
VVIAEKKRRMKSVFLTATLVLSLSLLVMMRAGEGKGWLLVGLFGYFWAFNLLEATLPSWVSKVAPVGSRGTAMGVYASCQFLGVFVGGVVGGYLVGTQGYSSLFMFMAALGGVWALVVYKSPPPRYLANCSFALPEYAIPPFDVVPGLLALPGVVDAMVVESERMVYLKVDRTLFKPGDAQAFLDVHADRQSLVIG